MKHLKHDIPGGHGLLVGDCDSQQALENEDDNPNLNRKRCRVAPPSPRRGAKGDVTTRDQEEGIGTEQHWLDDKMERHRIRIKY